MKMTRRMLRYDATDITSIFPDAFRYNARKFFNISTFTQSKQQFIIIHSNKSNLHRNINIYFRSVSLWIRKIMQN